MPSTPRQVLDGAYSLSRLGELAADVAPFAAAVAGAVAIDPDGGPPTLAMLEEHDAALVDALYAIEALATRAMKLLLEHALAGDPAIPQETRNVFAGTVTNYASDLGLLALRARDVASRGRSPDPDGAAQAVLEAARRVLDLRADLRLAVLAAARAHATIALPLALARAQDRASEPKTREKWSAARRDLEALAHDPTTLLTAPRAQRLATFPPLIDEPPEAPEPSIADLIELD